MKWRWRILGWTMNFFDAITLLAAASMVLIWLLTSVGLL